MVGDPAVRPETAISMSQAAIAIHSIDDPRVAVYRDLKAQNSIASLPTFVAEGLTLAERLLASGLKVDSVLAEERFAERLLPKLAAGVPLYVAPRQIVEALAGFNFHRGVLAAGYRPRPSSLDEWLAGGGERATFVVCAGVQDPENLGTIIRSSAAFGAAGVLLGWHSADPFSRRVARTSMGANFKPFLRVSPDLPDDLRALREQHGVELVAAVLDDSAEPLVTFRRVPRTALLFGSEGHGLPDELIALCDRRATIPMRHGTDSLNVSIAAGIFLHHFQDVCGVTSPAGVIP